MVYLVLKPESSNTQSLLGEKEKNADNLRFKRWGNTGNCRTKYRAGESGENGPRNKFDKKGQLGVCEDQIVDTV